MAHTYSKGDRVRFTNGPLAAAHGGHNANTGDIGVYEGPAPHMDGYDDWHIVTTSVVGPDGMEISVIPVHVSMFELV
jgi:hypothetical protein